MNLFVERAIWQGSKGGLQLTTSKTLKTLNLIPCQELNFDNNYISLEIRPYPWRD